MLLALMQVGYMYDDDDVGLNVLGCRDDIYGTNCNRLCKAWSMMHSVAHTELRRCVKVEVDILGSRP